jgi:hypothetical protein
MLANVWHWWIGVILTVLMVLMVLGLVGLYVKQVTAKKYPPAGQIDDIILE